MSGVAIALARLRAWALVATLAGCSVGPDLEAAHPYPDGCGVFELTPTQCTLAVETARDGLVTYPTAIESIDLLGDPCRSETRVCSYGPSRPKFVVRVRFNLLDGSSVEDSVYCGFAGTFPDCRDK